MRNKQTREMALAHNSTKMHEQVSRFIELLKREFPEIAIDVDAPKNPDGEWWLDISVGDFTTAVAWRPAFGFGLFTSEESGFGDKPNEVYRDVELAYRRICKLEASYRLHSTQKMWLRDLRHLTDIPQTRLADLLGKEQAEISRLEQREDVKLSTIAAYVRAIGGELLLSVRFPRFEAGIEPPAELNKKTRAST